MSDDRIANLENQVAALVGAVETLMKEKIAAQTEEPSVEASIEKTWSAMSEEEKTRFVNSHGSARAIELIEEEQEHRQRQRSLDAIRTGGAVAPTLTTVGAVQR